MSTLDHAEFNVYNAHFFIVQLCKGQAVSQTFSCRFRASVQLQEGCVSVINAFHSMSGICHLCFITFSGMLSAMHRIHCLRGVSRCSLIHMFVWLKAQDVTTQRVRSPQRVQNTQRLLQHFHASSAVIIIAVRRSYCSAIAFIRIHTGLLAQLELHFWVITFLIAGYIIIGQLVILVYSVIRNLIW